MTNSDLTPTANEVSQDVAVSKPEPKLFGLSDTQLQAVHDIVLGTRLKDVARRSWSKPRDSMEMAQWPRIPEAPRSFESDPERASDRPHVAGG